MLHALHHGRSSSGMVVANSDTDAVCWLWEFARELRSSPKMQVSSAHLDVSVHECSLFVISRPCIQVIGIQTVTRIQVHAADFVDEGLLHAACNVARTHTRTNGYRV